MPKLTIADVNPLIDGAYEIEVQTFTGRELHAIKKLTDLRPAEFEEAFGAADVDVVLGLAMVVLMRAGKITHGQPWLSEQVNALMDAEVGKITLDVSDVEEEAEVADAGPPSQRPTESESPSSGGDVSEPSGNGSSESSDQPGKIRSVTGDRMSPTGSISDRATSAI